ncbi:MAG: hypothetical protein JXB49_22265 [Bacteroidales bacterium]|nr:hypothetical protein [Bacteroidales bacterium]
MKKLIAGLVFLISCMTGYSQYDISEYYADTTRQEFTFENNSTAQKQKKIDFNLSAGAGFTSFKGYGNMFSNFIQPEWSYHVSPKFNINFGTTIIRHTYNGAPDFYSFNTNSLYGNFTSAMIYAEGEYKLTNRVTLSGMGYKEIPASKTPQGYNPYLFNYLNQGMAMSINYRIKDNMHIGASISINDGANTYSPLYNNFNNPFGYPSSNRGFLNPW